MCPHDPMSDAMLSTSNDETRSAGQISSATDPPGVLAPVGQRVGWRVTLLIVAIISLILAARLLGLGEHVSALRSWIQSLGSLGPLVYIVIYAGGVVLAVPGSVLSVAAGAMFGARVGIVVVSIGATTGASVAFLIARYLGRDSIVERFSHAPWFWRLERMAGERGALVVALARLIPLFPFNLLNYAFGLTRVSFGTYVFWSWLCMLPAIVVIVSGADAATQVIVSGHLPWTLLAIVAAGALMLGGLIRFARRSLRKRPSEPCA